VSDVVGETSGRRNGFDESWSNDEEIDGMKGLKEEIIECKEWDKE